MGYPKAKIKFKNMFTKTKKNEGILENQTFNCNYIGALLRTFSLFEWGLKYALKLWCEQKCCLLLKLELPKVSLFGTLKLALGLQFIVTNSYFSVACNTKVRVCNNELQR